MAYEVFISYSTRDKPIADAVCAKLEAEGMRCWIAPRDVRPGMNWGQSIVAAIRDAQVMVLVFSANANLSVQVVRELERAASRGLPIIPLRIEDVKPASTLEYYISTAHWLDALTPPLEEHLQKLARVVGQILGRFPRDEEPKEPIAAGPVARPTRAPRPEQPVPTLTQLRPARKTGRLARLLILLLPVIAIGGVAGWWAISKTRKAGATAVASPIVAMPGHLEQSTVPVDDTNSYSDGCFVELDGVNGFYASPEVPAAAVTALEDAKQENRELKSFAFSPTRDWVLIDSAELKTSAGPESDAAKDPGNWPNHIGNNTRCVAFAASGTWITVGNDNGRWGPGNGAWVKEGQLQKSGHLVRSVAFGLGKSWLILCDQAGVCYDGIPDELTRVLDDAASRDVPILCVAFCGPDWICLANSQWWTSDTNLPASRFIGQQYQSGRQPKWISFVPEKTILSEKWQAFTDLIADRQADHDADSAGFLKGILRSLGSPAGTNAGAIAADGQHMRDRVREQVRSGQLESAAAINLAQWWLLNQPGTGLSGPLRPSLKTGGQPGPGGLVLHLPCDQPDRDGDIRDESGAGNDGQVFGAKWVADTQLGGAYRFRLADLDDRIVVPNSDLLNPAFITVSAWVKAADKDGFFNRILDKDYRNAYSLSLDGDWKGKGMRGHLEWETSSGEVHADPVLDDNRWHNVAATYDGQMVRCYVDGIEKDHQPKKTGPLTKSTWDLCIGNSVVDYGTGEFLAFDGLISDVRIYNRALSAAEIKSLAARSK